MSAAGLSWREFLTYLTGLLAADTRLRRHFTTDTPDEGSPQ